jgi:hypothetical protein
MTEDQIRDLLREMRDEPIPPNTRVRVRVAVAERIQSGSWVNMFHGRWRIVAVLLATVSITAALLLLRPSSPLQEPTARRAAHQPDAQVERAAPPKKLAPTPPAEAQKAKHPARRMVQPIPPDVQESPGGRIDVLIRIETPDPDVVIVLVGD